MNQPKKQSAFAVSSAEDLLLLGNVYVASRALHTVAQWRIADLFKDGQSRSVDALAAELKVSPIALKRILRVLCPFGIFCEHENETFSLTEVGQQIQSNHPSSMRELLFCEECRWNGLGQMSHTLQTGKAGFSNLRPLHNSSLHPFWNLFAPFEKMLSKVYNKPVGRKSYSALMMFKCLLLQNCNDLIMKKLRLPERR